MTCQLTNRCSLKVKAGEGRQGEKDYLKTEVPTPDCEADVKQSSYSIFDSSIDSMTIVAEFYYYHNDFRQVLLPSS